jgi:hypothetical protein
MLTILKMGWQNLLGKGGDIMIECNAALTGGVLAVPSNGVVGQEVSDAT